MRITAGRDISRGVAKASAALLFLFMVAGNVSTAFALGIGSPVQLTNPLGTNCNDLSCPLQRIIDFLFTIAIPLLGIMILVGGFQMMTAAGNPEKFSQGKKTLLYSVIGFVVILLAGSVATLIQNAFKP